MDRTHILTELRESQETFDVLIIGGGATGLGCAVDSATRGYRTVLVERHDFASGTSSRSSKIIHGGLRYLKQANFSLVAEALRERRLLLKNAPDFVHELRYFIPHSDLTSGIVHRCGLGIYQLLAGRNRVGRVTRPSQTEIEESMPGLALTAGAGGLCYSDAQFDDAGLAIGLARTAFAHGATVLNYLSVERLLKERDRTVGAEVLDRETGQRFEIRARVVINASGPFSAAISELDGVKPPALRLSQGAHIVLDREFFPGDTALIAPLADNGRVLLAVPWFGSVVIGPTDTEIATIERNPVPRPEELAALLSSAARFLRRAPRESDVKSMFAGIRPLAGASSGSTATASREHALGVSPSGLVSITGGKWTTYRRMAQDTIDRAAQVGGLRRRRCVTDSLAISTLRAALRDSLSADDPRADERLHPQRRETRADVIVAARFEMARRVEDVLARRSRVLFTDARLAIELAPSVAQILADELGHDSGWIQHELRSFTDLAKSYLPSME
ncbi:MAG: glycerol-3-phosphate dehydrogenase/oxidase [Deltaproteobacteria bacterium]|nr:glycerol-3-phosphate dehydrogenase/oxidase [Deltaproteobacteria bacterium]